MVSHFLFEADFCNPASGWEKGQIEKNVQDSRHRIWQGAPSFENLDALNAWLEQRCLTLWQELRHPDLSAEKQQILDELLFRIEAVQVAEDKKYVLMNVPTENIEKIIEVLPGMKSPTIMPLAKEGWNSLHAVIDEKGFWEVIGKLKALGAEGILVIPIEKMIL
jgi:ATP phosphoribosyltransferase-like protein